MSRKTTIYDIARYLKVTPATVSYALNNVSKVSEETRMKVLEAAKELGYSRDYNAVSLSTGKTHLMVLFLPLEDISKAFLENQFYGEFIGSFEKQIQKHGYDLLIQPSIEEKELLPWLRGRGVDAIVCIGSFPKHYYKAFKTINKPVVLVDVFDEKCEEFNNVRIEDKDGTYFATEYLIKKGHRDIAFVSGDYHSSVVDQRRFEGYKEALSDYDIEFKDEYIFVSDVSVDAGAILAKEIMNSHVTAAMCAADSLAIGLMNGYRNVGKDIPNDLSIIGFDDIQAANIVYPGLTTVKQNISEKGRLSAKLLLDDLKNKEISHKNLILNPELIIRGTVKEK